jgi:3,4-dihydroxy 2-butanone 4-phosphate synthase/GTP cyclohydrolase II
MRQLELPDPWADSRQRLGMNLSAPFDAATGIHGGWSLRDRALTMRVAADPLAGPADLTIPGHVHAARIDQRRGDAASAAIELARLGERAPAVALCAVIDRHGELTKLRDALLDAELSRLPVAGTGELLSGSISRDSNAMTVSCWLPTADGSFRAVGYEPAGGDRATVALVHGDPSSVPAPLAHVHVACLFGDAFGSLLCDCRATLQAATAAIIAEGTGVIVYATPADREPTKCARQKPIDAIVAAGLLRSAGIQRLRLFRTDPRLAAALRRCGLEVDP